MKKFLLVLILAIATIFCLGLIGCDDAPDVPPENPPAVEPGGGLGGEEGGNPGGGSSSGEVDESSDADSITLPPDKFPFN